MQTIANDLRTGVRAIVKHPGYSAVVIATLALGIGVNAAIFSVVNAVLLRPLPYPEPDRLVRVWSAYPSEGVELGTASPLDLDDWREQSTAFEEMAGTPHVRLGGFVLTSGDAPAEVPTTFVTKGFFETLGVPSELGRTLSDAEHVEGANRFIVISHGSWRRRFGGDPSIVGGTVMLNGSAYTVLGVMPPEFGYPSTDTEIWAPLSLIPDSGVPRRRAIRWLDVVGRLEPGISVEKAEAEISAIAARLAAEYPDSNEKLTAVTVRSLHDNLVGGVRTAILALFGAVGLVLLIATTNVANVALARSEQRTREVAIRVAVGAGRWQITRQWIVEGLLLAVAGGVAGLLIGVWGVRILVAMAPAGIPRLGDVSADAAVLLFTAVLTVATGLATGLLPASRMEAAEPTESLKEGSHGATSSRRRRRFRSLLVVSEVALVTVLVIAAGLVIRSYVELLRVDPGVRAENLLTMSVTAQTYKYPETADFIRFFNEVLERVEKLPGVRSAGLVRPFPLRGDTFEGEGFGFTIDGLPGAAATEPREATLRFVSPGYFPTMGIPIIAGRDFDQHDDRTTNLRIIINRTAAERYWPGTSPVGQTVTVGRASGVEIIGVVGDVRQTAISAEPKPAVYVTFTQVSRVGMTLVVRTERDPASLISAVQQAIWDVDPDQPISQIATMEKVISDSLVEPRFSMTMLGAFAVLALVLAAVGIYGVVSYTTARRTHEIGIRMAVGAKAEDVIRAVLGTGMVPTAAGIAVGLLVAFLTTRLMRSLLFAIDPFDPITVAVGAALLAAVALLASLVPAARAARVDPVVLLRQE